MKPDPSRRLLSIDVLDTDEHTRLESVGNHSVLTRPAPAAPSIPVLWAAPAARTPEAVALTCQGRSMTFRRLDEAAIRLARILSSLADALTKLDRHTAGPACGPAEPDELPENIDDIRIDLARRIDAFIASRANAGLPDDAAAAAADGVQ